MLKDNAVDFVSMGELISNAEALWGLFYVQSQSTSEERLNDEGKAILRVELQELLEISRRLDLAVTAKLIGRRLGYEDSIPETPDEFKVIIEVLKDELSSKLFLFVPSELATFWEMDDLLTDEAKAAFPSAVAELRSACNAFAASLPEGSIFYSMRAVEHGLRALATDVGLVFDVQNWQNIINEIEAKVEGYRKSGIPGLAKSEKDARLQFLSEAAKEFAYFKDGWRNYVAHAKAPYTQHQAHTVLSHVADFIERLSAKLVE